MKLTPLLLVVALLAITAQASDEYLPGEIPYNFEVENGEAILKIPLPVLKGINKLEPNMNLEYRSNMYNQNSELGLAWFLTGLSEISRCFKSVAQDDAFDRIYFDYRDSFCLDGQRLVLVSGEYGYNGSEYRTEVNMHARVRAFGTQGLGPQYFVVQTRDNKILTFGHKTANSPFATNATNKWPLTKIEDYLGNSIDFTYTGNAVEMYLDRVDYANKQILFEYEQRPDVIRRHYDYSLNAEIKKRLKTIRIRPNDFRGLFEKRMQLEYVSRGPAQLSLLKSIKLCFEKDECLRPLTFDYSHEQEILKFEESQLHVGICGATDDCEIKQFVDMNGDGLTDIVAFGADGVYVTLNRKGSFGKAVKWTSEMCKNTGWLIKTHIRMLVDLNADRLPDIVGFGEEGVYVALNSNGTSFATMSQWTTQFGTKRGFNIDKHLRTLSDINNDGLPDIIALNDTGVFISYNKNGKMFEDAFLLSPTVNTLATTYAYLTSSPVFIEDLNADGILDIVTVSVNQATLTSQYMLFNRSYVPFKVHNFLSNSTWSMQTHLRVFGDLNNDNLPDLIGFRGTFVIVGQAQAVDKSRIEIPEVAEYKFVANDNTYRAFVDMDGDTYPDAVAFTCDGIQVSLNNGTGFPSAPQLWSTQVRTCGTTLDRENARSLVDINGDGLVDAVAFNGSMVQIMYRRSNAILKLASFSDSLQGRFDIAYDTLANPVLHTMATPQEMAVNCTGFGVNRQLAVASVAHSNQLSEGGSRTEYKYGGYTCSRVVGRQTCKFAWIEALDVKLAKTKRTEYYQEFPLAGSIRAEYIIHKNNTTLETKRNEYLVKNRDGIYAIVLKTSNTDYFDAASGVFVYARRSEYKHDEFGNVHWNMENVTDDRGFFSSRLSIIQVENDVAAWHIGRVVEDKSYFTRQSNETSTVFKMSQFLYNATTRLLIRRRYLPNDTLLHLEETFSHDTFGNVIRHVQHSTVSDATDRVENYEYDQYGINRVKFVNGLGHKQTYGFDLIDNMLWQRDANELLTEFKYDKMSRVVLQRNEDGTETAWSYSWADLPANAVMRQTKHNFDGSVESTIVDGFKKTIRTVTSSFEGKELFEDVHYNDMGLIARKSLKYEAYVEQPVFVSLEYDDMGREVVRREPAFEARDSTIVRTEYNSNFQTVRTDSLGNTRTEYRNILNEIVRVRDAVGSEATYDYDVFGNLVQVVDAHGAETRMEYNLNGKQTSLRDASFGTLRYTFNCYNELVSELDSRGQITKLEYDVLGRVVHKVEPEREITWLFDKSAFGLGKLSRVNDSAQNTHSYVYDQLGREVEVNQIILTDGAYSTYLTKKEYDSAGRVSKIVYPGHFVVNYCYNSAGSLAAISLNDSTCETFVWKASKYSATGSLTAETYGNGITQTYTYNGAYMLQEALTVNSFDTVLRRLQYTYDTNKNLVKRVDNTLYDTLSSIDRYAYDPLSRLTSSVTLKPAQGPSAKQSKLQVAKSQSFVYDAMGNMLSSMDSTGRRNNYQFDATKPQQAIQIGENVITYDTLGNVVSTGDYDVEWWSYLKAKSIRTKRSTTEFEYGHNYERIVKRVKDVESGNEEVTHYVGGVYEKVTETTKTNNHSTTSTTHRYFVRVNGRVIATRIVTATHDALVYSHADVIGNTDMITDESGALLVLYKFEAFGERSVLFTNTTNQLLTLLTRGYAGDHEYIDGGRLINMNGRIFDSLHLRFLSPDINVQDFYNIQNLNRYSYCLNNPFSYKDPSGYFFKKIFKAIKKIFVPLVGVGLAIITGGLMAPVAATMTAGIASTAVAAVAQGAIIGATSGFVSSMYFTGGNLELSLKGALVGGITGGISNGLNSAFNIKNVNIFEPKKFLTETMTNGVINKAQDRKFLDGLITRGISAAAASFYTHFTEYRDKGAVLGPGKDAVPKGYTQMPVEHHNNIGFQGPVQAGKEGWHEGGKYSVMANKIPGLNAISGMHDAMNIKIMGAMRETTIGNVGSMLPATVLTYAALYQQIQCPYCFK